jgi:hypothetical protein
MVIPIPIYLFVHELVEHPSILPLFPFVFNKKEYPKSLEMFDNEYRWNQIVELKF